MPAFGAAGSDECAGRRDVIRTEITIFEPLASAFAEECMRRF
jgi:hypothetical protein